MRQPLTFILSPWQGRGQGEGVFSPYRDGLATTLSAFLRRAGGRFLFVFAFHADLFQERFDRLFPAKKFFDRHRNVASIALLVNFVKQSQAAFSGCASCMARSSDANANWRR